MILSHTGKCTRYWSFTISVSLSFALSANFMSWTFRPYWYFPNRVSSPQVKRACKTTAIISISCKFHSTCAIITFNSRDNRAARNCCSWGEIIRGLTSFINDAKQTVLKDYCFSPLRSHMGVFYSIQVLFSVVWNSYLVSVTYSLKTNILDNFGALFTLCLQYSKIKVILINTLTHLIYIKSKITIR